MVFNHSEAQGVPKQAQNIEICAERKIIFLYFLKCHTRFASIVDILLWHWFFELSSQFQSQTPTRSSKKLRGHGGIIRTRQKGGKSVRKFQNATKNQNATDSISHFFSHPWSIKSILAQPTPILGYLRFGISKIHRRSLADQRAQICDMRMTVYKF